MKIGFMIGGAWLAVGIIITAKTYEPEQGGWLWSILLWPIVLLSKVLP
jgi:hypothetical protein